MVALGGETEDGRRQRETDTYIVDRIVHALSLLKLCKTEDMHQDYYVVLGACAPLRLDEKDQEGMIARVAKRLCVKRSNQGTRIVPFQRCIDNRGVFDKHVRSPPAGLIVD